jgi:hypothetical protein
MCKFASGFCHTMSRIALTLESPASMTVLVTYHTLRGAIALSLLLGISGCASSCNRQDTAEPAADTRTSGATAAKSNAPPAFAPRSHQLIEKSTMHVTPLRGFGMTPRAGSGGQGPESLWISASGDPDSGGVPLTVNFTVDVQGGSTDLSYRWDFGDNSPGAYQPNVQHTYRSVGDFTATLTVTSSDAEETDDVSIQVSEEGFDVSIDADPDIGKPPLTVHFSAVMDDDVPGPFSYQWDFGDGARDVANPTTHTYRAAGQYTANCVVTNSQGQIGRQEVDIQVDVGDEEQETQ